MTPLRTAAAPPPGIHAPRPRIDEALLQRIAAGDVEAFETLYDRLSGNVLGFAQQAVACGQEAERAVVQAFVEVWRRAAEFDGTVEPLAWVVGLCTGRLRELCPDPTGN